MRNYEVMRTILTTLLRAHRFVSFLDFEGRCSHNDARDELIRLSDEGLIKGKITLDNYIGYEIEGLTKEGEEFARNIENGEVFAIILKTLREASLDLSYPLLKEVCDEIVKRYVMGKIPKDI